MTPFEKHPKEAKDDDKYNTEADDESEKLEGSLAREKSSQSQWKAACRAATEAREKRTVVSQKE